MMRRVAAFVAACVFLLIVVAVGAVAFPATASHAAQITPTPAWDWICLYAGQPDGTPEELCFGLVASPPADATATPTVSATPTSTATATPSPSATETPVTPTATSTAEPSPTQETTPPPTVTPAPTTPPGDLVCYGTITATALNVRQSLPVEGQPLPPVITSLPNGTQVRIEAVADVGINLWGRVRWSATDVGYAAIYYGGNIYIERENSEDCLALFFPEPVTLYPALQNRFGAHITVGGNADILTAAVAAGFVTSIKATNDTETAVFQAKQANPDTLIIWRELKNGPDDWCQGNAETAARNWYAWNHTRWQNRGLLGFYNGARIVQWFEYRNEIIDCQPWEVVFDLWMMRLAADDEICLAIFSDAYGNPTVARFAARRPAIDYLLRHPCRPGEWHAIAKHDYEGADSGLYKFWRWQLYLDALGHGIYDRVTWVISEYGLTYGYGPTACEAWNADRKLADQYWSQYPEILTAHHWNVGGAQWGWFDITECLAMLLRGELTP